MCKDKTEWKVGLFKNETLTEEFLDTLYNLGTLGSNLSRHGLLGKPRFPKPSPGNSADTGRNPFR